MTHRVLRTVGTPDPDRFCDIYIAKVVTSSDPLGRGRVLLSVPQALGTATSNWALPVGIPAGVLPPVSGSVVYVSFLGGDRNHPVYFPQNWAAVPETPWFTFAARGYQNSWTDGTLPAKYRLASNNNLEITGEVTAGTLTNNTVIVNLPAGTHPASAQPVPITVISGTPTNTWPSPFLQLNTNGNLVCENLAGLTGGTVFFHAFITLD